MIEDRLDAHLKRWEKGQEEMVEVPKGYLEWLKAENERLRELILGAEILKAYTTSPEKVGHYWIEISQADYDALKAGEDDDRLAE